MKNETPDARELAAAANRLLLVPEAGEFPDKESIEKIKTNLVSAKKLPALRKVTVGKHDFIIRALNGLDWAPVDAYQKANREADFQDLLDTLDQKTCQLGIVWPQHCTEHPLFWDLSEAGLRSTLARHIRSFSGFMESELQDSGWVKVENVTSVEPDAQPSEDVLKELQTADPRRRLGVVRIGTSYFVIQGLNRLEFRTVQQKASQPNADPDAETAKLGVRWSRDYPNPPDFDGELAGTITTLGVAITRLSGFPTTEPLIEEL